MYVCMYVSMNVCAHACSIACMYLCMHIHTRIHAHICVDMRVYVYWIYIYIYICVCVCVCVCVCASVCKYVWTAVRLHHRHCLVGMLVLGCTIHVVMFRSSHLFLVSGVEGLFSHHSHSGVKCLQSPHDERSLSPVMKGHHVDCRTIIDEWLCTTIL